MSKTRVVQPQGASESVSCYQKLVCLVSGCSIQVLSEIWQLLLRFTPSVMQLGSRGLSIFDISALT
jgi:hypothetical protein